MGVTCDGPNDKRTPYQNHKKFRRQLFEINNEKYSCTNCYRIPEFKEIDFENQKVLLFCPKHGKKKIEIKDYLVQMDKIIKGSCAKCGDQKNIVNDLQNDKQYCEKCFNKIYTSQKNKCKDHPKSDFSAFCETCNQYICSKFEKHKNYHEKHQIFINNNKCKKHSEDDFSAFCETCNQYICSQFKEHKNYHKDHQIFKKEEYEPQEEELNSILLFIKFLSIIYETYIEDKKKDYFHCINIKNFTNFLKGYNSLDLFNKNFNCNIKSYDKKINLKEKEIGDVGLKLFCKLKFEKLEQLILENNKISNIDDLKYLSCPKLNKINLGHNNIRNINILQNINFPLEELDLSSNRIDNINVFENMSNNGLKKLKKLNLYCNNFKLDEMNNNIQKQIKEKLKDKFNGEENEEFSKILKKIDNFNASYNTAININDKAIDLSLINTNNNDYHQMLEEFKHPNVTSIKLGKSENNNIDFKNISKNCPKCNSLIFEDKQIYLRNPNPWDIKFKKKLTDLEFVAKLEDKKSTYQELFPYTFTCFTSINNKQQYLIYYENTGNKADIYLVNNFKDKNKNKILSLQNISLIQIKYYIDVQEQKDILLGSVKEPNKSSIYYWEFTEEKLNLISQFNGGISFCMISDKIFCNNFIISSDDKETLYIWTKEKEIKKNIYLNDSRKNNSITIYFIDSYNYIKKNSSLQSNNENNIQTDYENKYYIIVGDEEGYISFEFISTKDEINIKKNKRYSNRGENKYAIVYSDSTLINLIGSDFKSNEIKIFSFDSGCICGRINLDINYISLGINLWNSQYLIVCCKKRENNSIDKEIKAIKIFEIDDANLFHEIQNKSGALFSLKFMDNNSKEYIIIEYLDGTIELYSC